MHDRTGSETARDYRQRPLVPIVVFSAFGTFRARAFPERRAVGGFVLLVGGELFVRGRFARPFEHDRHLITAQLFLSCANVVDSENDNGR